MCSSTKYLFHGLIDLGVIFGVQFLLTTIKITVTQLYSYKVCYGVLYLPPIYHTPYCTRTHEVYYFVSYI